MTRTEAERAESLWNVNDVAAYLQVSPQTVRSWRLKGEDPPSFTVGRHVRYRREDVERWLQSKANSRPVQQTVPLRPRAARK